MAASVVITGLGLVSPLGEGASANWFSLSGSHALMPSPRAPSSDPKGPVRTLRVRQVVGRGPAAALHESVGPGLRPAGTTNKGWEQAQALAFSAADEALRDAALWDGAALAGIDPERVGCTFSASKPLAAPGPTPESPPQWRAPDDLNQAIYQQFGVGGECRNVIAACATGAYAVALGASWIEQGLCDAVLAGSAEPFPHPLIEAGFRQMGVLSPDGITRPFDRRRSGFAIGFGAGAVVLESESSARRRGCRAYARLSGWALGSDAHSAVAFNSNGQRVAGVITRALARAGLAPEAIGHVHAHGTATRINDRIETQAIQRAFGAHAGRLRISGTKASTGHLLGASGSVELVLTVLALLRQWVPPTATLSEPDPECPLDFTPGCGQPASFDHAASLSFGFGGPIGVLTVSAC